MLCQNKNQPLFDTLKARNSSSNEEFECFTCGKSSFTLDIGENAYENQSNALFVEEKKNFNADVFSDEMKHRHYAPLFDEYPNEELEGFLEDDCVFEIKD